MPAGAVPKDGPSAGVAMATALTSLVPAGRSPPTTAMTGEMTLTGQVLPVGGLKEKSLAAQRAGIKRVIVPDRNEGEILEIPEHERAGLEFVYVDRIEQALEAAIGLDDGLDAAGIALGPGGYISTGDDETWRGSTDGEEHEGTGARATRSERPRTTRTCSA